MKKTSVNITKKCLCSKQRWWKGRKRKKEAALLFKKGFSFFASKYSHKAFIGRNGMETVYSCFEGFKGSRVCMCSNLRLLSKYTRDIETVQEHRRTGNKCERWAKCFNSIINICRRNDNDDKVKLESKTLLSTQTDIHTHTSIPSKYEKGSIISATFDYHWIETKLSYATPATKCI